MHSPPRPGFLAWNQWEKDHNWRQMGIHSFAAEMAKRKFRLISLGSTMKMRAKLNALLLGALCVSSLLLGCDGSRGSQKIPVVVDSAPLAGVEIIVPGDARFDQEARQIVGAKLDPVEALSPLLMWIKNNSQHTIVAYSPEWDLKRGSKEIPWVALRTFPMAISGPECDFPQDRPIRPGEERLESMNSPACNEANMLR
jgi:hypothetical protein